MTERLVVLLGGVRAGTVTRTRDGLRFTYDEAWRASDLAYPMSLTMPLSAREHGDEAIRAYMSGLLPDDADVRSRWSAAFGSHRTSDPFTLLGHVGGDLAGAAQFLSEASWTPQPGGSPRVSATVQPLDTTEIEIRLGRLAHDPDAARLPGDAGYFSLGGRNPKTALVRVGTRWGIPAGADIATTHILKPPAAEGLEGLAENEHLCLRILGASGHPAANSAVLQFGGRRCLVVERYDRVWAAGRCVRLHQERYSQAMVGPALAAPTTGDPDPALTMVRSIRTHSSRPVDDVIRFVTTLGMNWALGITDACTESYSMLIAPGGQVRLAPRYGTVSVLPHPKRYFPMNVRLAMSIGGEDRLWHIQRRHWERFATDADLDPEEVLMRLTTLLSRIPDIAARVCDDARAEGLAEGLIDRFQGSVTGNAMRCGMALRRS